MENMPSNTTRCALLLSGGQDSGTSLFWALKEFDEVFCYSFQYGQKHSVEIEMAKRLASENDCPHEIIDIEGLLGNSSLLDGSDHNEAHPLNPDLPASFVPARNILFLTIVSAKASAHGIRDIVTGVCETDFSGYPDCRRETINSLEETLLLGMGMGKIRIWTPLMYLNKAETWRLAGELDCVNEIKEKTITDYNGDLTPNDWGYGKEDNPASILRAKGYREAKEKGWVK